jgi:hypothetical protein
LTNTRFMFPDSEQERALGKPIDDSPQAIQAVLAVHIR